MLNNLSHTDFQWIFQRSKISGSIFTRFAKYWIRLIKLVLSLYKIIFTVNLFSIKLLSKGQNLETCIVLTKQKSREINVIKNSLSDISVFDIVIDKKFSLTSIARLIDVLYLFKKYNFTSIVDISEIYDLDKDSDFVKKIIRKDIFVSHDGSNPISRFLCLVFNFHNKSTVRILGSVSNPKKEELFKYNFLLETFSGCVDDSWESICGTPWSIDSKKSKTNSKVIGVIGNPSPYFIFGLEYWLLPMIFNLKKYGYIVKVRLHPQSPLYSKYMLRILGVSVSEGENEAKFISSLSCLIATYRTTLIDLAEIYECYVILHNANFILSSKKYYSGVTEVSLYNHKMLRNTLLKGGVKYKSSGIKKAKCKSIIELVFG
jgi:hypothetical protein